MHYTMEACWERMMMTEWGAGQGGGHTVGHALDVRQESPWLGGRPKVEESLDTVFRKSESQKSCKLCPKVTSLESSGPVIHTACTLKQVPRFLYPGIQVSPVPCSSLSSAPPSSPVVCLWVIFLSFSPLPPSHGAPPRSTPEAEALTPGPRSSPNAIGVACRS
jgi:hypothetical protein